MELVKQRGNDKVRCCRVLPLDFDAVQRCASQAKVVMARYSAAQRQQHTHARQHENGARADGCECVPRPSTPAT